MRRIEVGFGTVVQIPESWDYFVWRGVLYRKDAFNRWVLDRRIEKKTA
jgi:hypothetical protein